MDRQEIDLHPLVGLAKKVSVPRGDIPEVPGIKYGYVLPQAQAQAVCRWWFAQRRVQSLFLVGPSGCGKTSLIQQLCALLNWPLYSVRMNSTTRPEDMEGSMALVSDGNGGTRTQFVPGAAMRAYRQGGVLLLDEGNRGHPSVHSWLNAMVEGYPITLMQTGETVNCHDDFRAVMTGNAKFSGDETGGYVDSQPFCVSFASRFRTIEFGYPTDAEEVEIVVGVAPRIPRRIASEIVAVGRKIRQGGASLTNGAPIAMPFSVRHLEALACAVGDEYEDVAIADVFSTIYTNAFNGDDAAAVRSMLLAAVGDQLKKSLLTILEDERVAAERAAKIAKVKPSSSSPGTSFTATVAAAPAPAPSAGAPAGVKGRAVKLADKQVKEVLAALESDWTVLHCTKGTHNKVFVTYKNPVLCEDGRQARLSFYGKSDAAQLQPACEAYPGVVQASAGIRSKIAEKTSSTHKDGGYDEIGGTLDSARFVKAAQAAIESFCKAGSA